MNRRSVKLPPPFLGEAPCEFLELLDATVSLSTEQIRRNICFRNLMIISYILNKITCIPRSRIESKAIVIRPRAETIFPWMA